MQHSAATLFGYVFFYRLVHFHPRSALISIAAPLDDNDVNFGSLPDSDIDRHVETNHTVATSIQEPKLPSRIAEGYLQVSETETNHGNHVTASSFYTYSPQRSSFLW